MRPHADAAFGPEQRLAHVGERSLQVADGEPLVDGQTLELHEGRIVRGVAGVDEDAGEDDARQRVPGRASVVGAPEAGGISRVHGRAVDGEHVAAAVATEHDRRSIYLTAKRNLRLPFLEVFDAPALMASCGRRESSTHAPQALELLNGRTSNELAEAFARRLDRETASDRDRCIDGAYALALGRPPTARERELSAEFLKDQSLREFALALFNLNEFLYVP